MSFLFEPDQEKLAPKEVVKLFWDPNIRRKEFIQELKKIKRKNGMF